MLHSLKLHPDSRCAAVSHVDVAVARTRGQLTLTYLVTGKIPQRFLSPLRERFARGERSPVLTLGVAAWMRYVSGTDETGAAIPVSDPMAAQLRAIATRAEGRPRCGAAGPALVGAVPSWAPYYQLVSFHRRRIRLGPRCVGFRRPRLECDIAA